MRKILLLAVIAGAMTYTGCKVHDTADATRLNVRITDAPGAYDALFLSVKEVQVLTSDDLHILEVGDQPFDILRFRLGKDTLLASRDIPAGHIREVRLVLNDSDNRVIIDGKSYELTTPSGQSSGVKVKVDEALEAGVGYTLTLDFDAAKSIVRTGNGKYILKPVIRAIPNAVSGAIAGEVSPVQSNPRIYAIQGTDTLGTVSDSLGKFYFPGVPAGTYKIEFRPDSPYVAKTLSDIQVTAGSVKNLGTVTLGIE
ncbi:MAG TPA: DUF4382 domain-containing protein [Sphingobacteriaceae bacterium]